jgi:hypothetical protein
MKMAVFWVAALCGLVKFTDVSGELAASMTITQKTPVFTLAAVKSLLIKSESHVKTDMVNHF